MAADEVVVVRASLKTQNSSQLTTETKTMSLMSLFRRRPYRSSRPSRRSSAVLVVLLGCLVAHSQDFHFLFDPNGNLDSQFPASLAVPQILAQPQPQVVKPGELASFVVVADTRGLAYQWRFNGASI